MTCAVCPANTIPKQIARFLDYHFREWLRSKISTEALPSTEPPVDRFAFSSHARRWNARAFWIVVAAALLAAAGIVTAPRRAAAHVTAFAAFGSLVGCAWWLRRRATYLDSVLEISPFAIREVHSSGLRRTLLWRDAAWLVNRPRLGRVDVTTSNRRERIPIHYERLEFYKAMQLVVDYGGFSAAKPPPN